MDKILHDLIYLSYGIYGTILYLGHAKFCPSAVSLEACMFFAALLPRLTQVGCARDMSSRFRV